MFLIGHFRVKILRAMASSVNIKTGPNVANILMSLIMALPENIIYMLERIAGDNECKKLYNIGT